MDQLLQSVKIAINEKIYVKDPQSTELGKRIVEKSIEMIHDLGFERFTLKKLGEDLGSNESSMYRYFENKHKLLLYLASWYWGWLEYQLVFSTHSITDPAEKLNKAITVVTRATVEDSAFSHVNEVLLNKIVINEYSKSYLTKEVDTENKDGYFSIYKRLVARIGEMIIAVDPAYPFPVSLASAVLEGALHQYFLIDHFKSLTNCHGQGDPTKFFQRLVFGSLNTAKNG